LKYLKKPSKKDKWAIEEDKLLFILMNNSLKGKWCQMKKLVIGRNEIQIKNRWNTLASGKKNVHDVDFNQMVIMLRLLENLMSCFLVG
jgi:hypothetical protein